MPTPSNNRPCRGPSRRELLRVGLLSAFGLGLEDLLRPRPHPRSPRPNSIAGALIREHLKDGPIMAERMLDFVKAAGVSKDTANRAKRELQVRSAQREQRGKNHWFWFPPDWSEKQVTAWTPNGQASK